MNRHAAYKLLIISLWQGFFVFEFRTRSAAEDALKFVKQRGHTALVVPDHE